MSESMQPDVFGCLGTEVSSTIGGHSLLWSLQLFFSNCFGLSDLSRQALTSYQWLRLFSLFLKWQIFDRQTNQCEQFLPNPLPQKARRQEGKKKKKRQACPDYLITQECVPQDITWQIWKLIKRLVILTNWPSTTLHVGATTMSR